MDLEPEIKAMLSRGVVVGSPPTTQAISAGEVMADVDEISRVLLARIDGLEEVVLRLAHEMDQRGAEPVVEPTQSSG